MIEFALAVFFLIITPGPGVLSLAGVGSAYGYRTGLSYLMGLWIGHNTVVMLVISGIAATALAVPWLRVVLAWASVGYLLYRFPALPSCRRLRRPKRSSRSW